MYSSTCGQWLLHAALTDAVLPWHHASALVLSGTLALWMLGKFAPGEVAGYTGLQSLQAMQGQLDFGSVLPQDFH